MNKLLIDKENNIEIKDNAIELDIKVKDLTLNIKGNVLINEINEYLSEKLDNIDIPYDEYMLEVSSPGVERVLRKEKHFMSQIGNEISIKLFLTTIRF